MYNIQTIYNPNEGQPLELRDPLIAEHRRETAYKRVMEQVEHLIFTEFYDAHGELHKLGDLLWLLPDTKNRDKAQEQLDALHAAMNDLEKTIHELTHYDNK